MSIKKKLSICMIILVSLSISLTGFVLYNVFQSASIESAFFRILVISFSLIFFILILLIVVMTFILVNSVINPLNKLYTMASEIKKGNLDFQIDYTDKDEFGKVFEEIDEIRKRLKKSLEQQLEDEKKQKEMLVSIVHDIKTPMTAISGYIQGIIDGIADNPEKRMQYLQIVLQKSMIVDKLINDLFLFSKLEMNRMQFEMEEVYLINFLTDIFSSIEAENTKVQVKLNYNIDEETIVFIDKFQFKRVLHNIIDNSIKYKKTENIEMLVEINNKSNNNVIIKLQDNGMGVAEEYLEKIFEKFFRSDTSRSNKGSGLGLSISKEIVESFGGKIWARSNTGEGLSIYISLPERLQC